MEQFQRGRDLLAGLKSLYTNENNFADLKIKTKDGMIISAHKLILAARSPILKVLIEKFEKHAAKENGNEALELPSVNAKPFLSILHWMYTDELTPECGKFLDEVVDGASAFKLNGLLELIDENMINFCKPNNMFELFRVAEKHKLNLALPMIASYIKTNIDNLLPPTVVRRQSKQLVSGQLQSACLRDTMPRTAGATTMHMPSKQEIGRLESDESVWSRGIQYLFWIFIAWIVLSVYAANLRQK